jgi:protein-disulfide isomerase
MKRLDSVRWRFGLVVVAAAAITSALIGASQLTAGREGPTAAADPQRVPVERTFAGIPQQGPALGRRLAPVTLVEYADLQCPYCAQWALQTVPVLARDYVRTGRLRIVFRGLAFLGPDSRTALEATVAAGRQNTLWDVVEALYRRQGTENSGWVTEELLADVARGIARLDSARWGSDRELRWTSVEIARAARSAQAVGVSGTPAFMVGPTGGRLEPVALRSLGPEGIVPAIEAALRR